MKKLKKKKHGFDLCDVTMAAWSHTQIVCDIVTSQICARPVKMDEHKHNKQENIEKKVGIFHILNGILPNQEM